MPYPASLSSLTGSVRTRGEFHSPRPADADVRQYVNESYADLRDVLIRADQQRFAAIDDISVVAGTAAYDLPANHLRTIGVSVADPQSASGWRALSLIDEQERHIYYSAEVSRRKQDARWLVYAGQLHVWPEPKWSATVRHLYVAAPIDLEIDGSDDAEEIDCVSGLGREYLILGAMIRCGESEDRDTQQWEARRDRIAIQISVQLRMQRSEPIQVADVYSYSAIGTPRARR